jgi:hypothetical protein
VRWALSAGRLRRSVAWAVACFLAVGGAACSGAGDDSLQRKRANRQGHPVRSQASPTQAAGAWRELPTTGLSGYSLKTTYLFWTGEELITIDTTSGQRGISGEVYRPGDGSVRRIAESNLEWRVGPAVTWTGEDVIVAGGSNGPGITHPAAAYNLATDTWREIPVPPDLAPNPFENKISGPAVWTGSEMIVTQSATAYNPTTSTWRSIAPSPIPERVYHAITMTPHGVLVWGGCHPTAEIPNCDDFSQGQRLTDGAIYDPASDSWATLPQGPLGAGDHPSAVWTGTEVVVLLNEPRTESGAVAAAFDPETWSWRALPAPAQIGHKYAVSAWTGRYVLTHSSEEGTTTAFDPGSDRWQVIMGGPVRDRQSAVWTGTEFVVAGGYPSAAPWALSLEGL